MMRDGQAKRFASEAASEDSKLNSVDVRAAAPARA